MPILFEIADHVARVTIDRPDVLNAIDAASLAHGVYICVVQDRQGAVLYRSPIVLQ